MLYIVILYFLLLLFVSHLTARKSSNAVFFRGEQQSPWHMVAFGMVGASISGITFVSVPGMVLHSDMTYLQMCMGFIVGYFVIAYVLLPVYYRLNITSIYSVLRSINDEAYKTGAAFFIISKLLGTAAKFYVPCYIISSAMNIPFYITVVLLLVLIWLYTRRGGIKTLVWTDTLQTSCLLAAVVLIIYKVSGALDFSIGQSFAAVWHDSHSRIFEFTDWQSSQFFWKQFLSGIFIVIVMTGLDQDMMQKNLTCKSLRAAQKDMCTYGFAFVPVNFLFLALGVMLVLLYGKMGMALPDRPDSLLTDIAVGGSMGTAVLVFFTIGIIAASFSTVDSALTALTTSFCVDICDKPENESLRKRIHIIMVFALIACIALFQLLNTTSLINAIYTLVSYTYGPLLGLFAFALTNKKYALTNKTYAAQHVNCSASRGAAINTRKGTIIAVCILAPLLCLLLDTIIPLLTDYHFGYELLVINGALTYIGLLITSRDATVNHPPRIAQ